MAFDPLAFARNPIYSGTLAPSQLRGDIDQLRQADKAAEAELKKAEKATCLAIVLIVVGIFLLPILIGFLPLAIGVGLLVVNMRKKSALAAQDFEDRRYETLDRIVRLLEPDLGPQGKLTVQLDLRSVRHPSKEQGKSRVGPWQVTHFTDPWLSVEGVFLDGTKFRFMLSQAHQQRYKTYISRSGKHKSKIKYKDKTQALLQLRVKAKRYGELDRFAAGAERAIQLPSGAQLKRIQLKGRLLTIQSFTKQSWSGRWGSSWLALQLLSAYQILNLARRVQRAA